MDEQKLRITIYGLGYVGLPAMNSINPGIP